MMKAIAVLIGMMSMAGVAHAGVWDEQSREFNNQGDAVSDGGGVYVVPSPSDCSNAGDETARPVYRTLNGQPVLLGFECVQDNRGSN